VANITDDISRIRAAIYGEEVRESIASGIENINAEVESTTSRQTVVESRQTEVEGEQDALGVRQDVADAHEVTRQTNETTRVTEFDDIKTDYDIYKNVMIDASPVANLQNQINNNVAQLYDNTPHEEYEGKKYLINNPYRYGGNLQLKGQTHCHTTNSDGVDSPTALVTSYKNAGYNFMTITDHNFITPNPNVAGVTWIGTSCEESQELHVNAFNIDTRDGTLTNAQDIMLYHRNNGKMTTLNHSNWSSNEAPYGKPLSKYDIVKFRDYNFIEVVNGATETFAEKQWDWALSSGHKVFGIAADDCHDITNFGFNSGWIIVKANENTKDTILSNMRKGNFYASNGNDILINVVDNIITASSTASSNLSFIGLDGRILQTNTAITSANYTIKGNELYVRVVSTRVSDSKKAWSQPIFIDSIGTDGSIATKLYPTVINPNLVINGNYEINQGRVSQPIGGYFIDRWKISGSDVSTQGMSQSIIQLNNGELPNALKYCRISSTADFASAYAGLNYILEQSIEDGTRHYCGYGKKVTLSFWARSNIVGKRIGLNLIQAYGTGGYTSEQLVGKVITLTNVWEKLECTFVTNSIIGKTIGVGDSLILRVWIAWNSSFDARFNGNAVSEIFGGAMQFDIANIKLEQGDLATPFIPRSTSEELSLCQRYYEVSDSWVPVIASDTGQVIGTNFMVQKRIAPTITITAPTSGTTGNLNNLSDATNFPITAMSASTQRIQYMNATGTTKGNAYIFKYIADAEM